MTYGNQALKPAIEQLMEQGVEDIIVLPLYFIRTTDLTVCVSDGLTKAFKQMHLLSRAIALFEIITLTLQPESFGWRNCL